HRCEPRTFIGRKVQAGMDRILTRRSDLRVVTRLHLRQLARRPVESNAPRLTNVSHRVVDIITQTTNQHTLLNHDIKRGIVPHLVKVAVCIYLTGEGVDARVQLRKLIPSLERILTGVKSEIPSVLSVLLGVSKSQVAGVTILGV